jgi:mannose-6-phosphate isomerase-like protein (cupin superfamily)
VTLTDPIHAIHVPHAESQVARRQGDAGGRRALPSLRLRLRPRPLGHALAGRPRRGPRRHRHPHAEIFVLHDSQARYEVECTNLDAQASDVVIVPPDAWHSFVNTGPGMLRRTAIHQNARAVTDFEDGTRRD